MGKLIFVTGGARSGKSTFAEEYIKKLDGKTSYIATAIPFDEGMRERIKKHQSSRPSEWDTIEMYKNFEDLKDDESFNKSQNIIFDCLTVMTSNQLMEKEIDWDEYNPQLVEKAEREIFQEVNKLLEVLREKDVIIVSNEVGSGIVPANYFSSTFRDIQGRLNQYLASNSDEVYLVVSGISLQLK